MSKKKRFPISFSFGSEGLSVRHNGRPIDGIRVVNISKDFSGPLIANIEVVISPLRKK